MNIYFARFRPRMHRTSSARFFVQGFATFLTAMLTASMLAVCSPAALAAEPGRAEPGRAEPNPRADTATSKAASAKAAIKADATPVSVQLEGTDTLGSKLAFQLKEIFNSGTLFSLTAKEEPKILLIISTASEFPSRPEVGSAYSAVWVYYERPTAFTSYLAGEVGVVSPDGVDNLAARLAERTSGIATKYAYIFNK